MYSASQFEKPEVPHSVVTASDGSQWYQMASGEGRGAFYDAPVFGGAFSGSTQETAAAMEEQAVASSIGAEVEAIQQGMGTYPGNGMANSSGEEVVMPGEEAPAFGSQFVQGTDGEMPAVMTLDGTQEMQQGMPVLSQDAVPGEPLTAGMAEAPAFGASFIGGVETMPQGITENQSGEDVPMSMPAFTGEPSSITPVSLQHEDGGAGMPAFIPSFAGSSESIQEMGAEEHPIGEPTLVPGSPLSTIPGDDHQIDGNYMPEGTQFAGAYVGGSQEMPHDGGFYQTDFAPAEHQAGPGNSSQHENQYGENTVPAYSEAPLVAATFPSAQEGTMLRTVGEGVIEASSPDGGNTLWYNSAFYHEPDAPHSTMEAANGVQWYTMQQKAEAPQFDSGADASQYNQAAFQNFMPGYDLPVSRVDGEHRQDGHFEVRHADGSGTAFYDTARYAAPRGDYQVFEDSRGSQWYAIRGDAAVERRPVFENGQAVYENDKLKTVTVETVRYKQTPAKFSEPKKRGDIERKPPRRKK